MLTPSATNPSLNTHTSDSSACRLALRSASALSLASSASCCAALISACFFSCSSTQGMGVSEWAWTAALPATCSIHARSVLTQAIRCVWQVLPAAGASIGGVAAAVLPGGCAPGSCKEESCGCVARVWVGGFGASSCRLHTLYNHSCLAQKQCGQATGAALSGCSGGSPDVGGDRHDAAALGRPP